MTEWISLQFILDLTFTIKKGNGADLLAADSVAFLSNPVSSLFLDAELIIGGITVEGLTQSWGPVGVLKALIGVPATAAKTYARDAFKLIPDQPGQSQAATSILNSGFASRALLTADSAYTSVIAPLPFDLSQSSLAVPNNTHLSIRLTHQTNPERLQSNLVTANYILDISSISLMVTYLTLSEHASSTLQSRLSANQLSFPYLRLRCRQY